MIFENILQSASKIVLIIISVAVCVAFIMRILDSKDFMILAAMVFTYYFSYTPNTKPAENMPPATIK